MGHRTVKRVPLDFSWPLRATWEGYLLPASLRESECINCAGRGATTSFLWVQQIAALLLLLSDDLRAQELGRPMHPYFNNCGSIAYGTRPGRDITDFTAGLAGRSPSFMGHDGIDRWSATAKLIEAAGLPETWGRCPACGGHGSVERYPGQREAAKKWKPTEPPAGDGWQLWETVSEGSPTSPVFATAEALADWCETGATWFGPNRWTRAEWLASFEAGTTDTDSLLIVRAEA